MAGERRAGGAEPVRRMRRAERREQILDAATRAFARGGYAMTGLDEVAQEAGITRVILYRHFESKTEMYRSVLDRAQARLRDTVGDGDFDNDTFPALLRAAAADPDGFRLLFRYAAREPEFREVADGITARSREITHGYIVDRVADPEWRDWAARLVPTVAIEGVIAWLDAGQPDPDGAARRILRAVNGVTEAAAWHGEARP